MDKANHFAHVLHSAAVNCAASRLIATVKGLSILKIDYQGSDMRMRLSNGKEIIFSAVECGTTGKPIIEFEIS